MSSIEKQINDERRITHLLCTAINSQLELEKATKNLIRNVYKDLERIEAAGCSSEDWMAMFDIAQQLVDTLGILTADEGPIPKIEERKVVIEVEKDVMNESQTEEDIEEYLEALLKEIHPNLNQIRAAASLEEEELHDVFGLSNQMTKPHESTFDRKIQKATTEKEDDRVKRKKKKKKKKKGGKR
ncbi:hypothetical protein EAE96_009650 [Botrytis aclada]|nr:hypothetical protein EAE96_009650 [Botrytis aclada]